MCIRDSTSYGRVRALVNPLGKHVDEAYPADPVEILGLNLSLIHILPCAR